MIFLLHKAIAEGFFIMFLLNLIPLIIIIMGIFLLIKLKFFYILHPIQTLKFAFSGKNIKNSTFSLILALAGTLGVGNIVGVAFGIYTGGPGSIFWLVISALFSSAIKYAEVNLSARYQDSLGMISVIKSKGRFSGELAFLYSTLVLILSFTMGSLLQAEAISESARAIGDKFCTFILTGTFVFTAVICILGKDKIKNAVAVVIPLASAVYIFMCCTVIFKEYGRIISVSESIIGSAFDFSAASGGISGFLLSSGIKEGFARGLLSNEAGAGTSSFSHTSHFDCIEHEKDSAVPIKAGVYGILEVVFDTLFLCPLTGFAILLGSDGIFTGTLSEISDIFVFYIGDGAKYLLLFSVTAFAISTVLCWYYYGRTSFAYVTKKRFTPIFSILFILSFGFALYVKTPSLIFINDTILFFLSVITVNAIIKNIHKIRGLKFNNQK